MKSALPLLNTGKQGTNNQKSGNFISLLSAHCCALHQQKNMTSSPFFIKPN